MFDITLSATDTLPEVELTLEHSLVSLSKWESKHEKPFYGKEPKTVEETIDYLAMMIVGRNAPEEFSDRVIPDMIADVNVYINSKQSATWFREEPSSKSNSGEVVTSELIYYWLIQFQIPFEPVETWHIARLMNLIKICGIKQAKPKTMSKQAQAEQYRRLNAERREQLGTAG